MEPEPIPDDIRPIVPDDSYSVVYTFEEIQDMGNKYNGVLDLETGLLLIKEDE